MNRLYISLLVINIYLCNKDGEISKGYVDSMMDNQKDQVKSGQICGPKSDTHDMLDFD